ncbi:NUDIX domain-containing protein [Sedimentimonas flavescens]|uniref:NUDIX domain-containing protein n=1 Tax=Sedimentimonas flavescens TaxID=2851012 RepID=UPI002E2836F2|nr:NUDIX domain-containing protein [Sedimentimonas flavescens]
MEIQYFFYGTLCHVPLLRAVMGREPRMQAATLAGFRVHMASDGAHDLGFPILVEGEGSARGVLVSVSASEAERLNYYEAGFTPVIRTVRNATGTECEAQVYLSDGRWLPGAEWNQEAWTAIWGDIATEAAQDFMAGMGHITPERALARYPMMLVRAASRLRARGVKPAELRRSVGAGDLAIHKHTPAYARFFAVEEYDLQHSLFAGGMSRTLERAAFVSGDASVVLPYDPLRDRVLLIEQFRVGPMARGDTNPWLIEPIAGRVDPTETPEQAALREAGEEAGITLSRLIAAPSFYPSPGAKSEYLYCYVGLADLPDGAGRPGGVEAEGEDIRPHLISFDELMHLIETGEADNGPLLVLALWLARQRPALRAEAGIKG